MPEVSVLKITFSLSVSSCVPVVLTRPYPQLRRFCSFGASSAPGRLTVHPSSPGLHLTPPSLEFIPPFAAIALHSLCFLAVRNE